MNYVSFRGTAMRLPKPIAAMLSGGLIVVCVGVVSAQNFPSKPLRIVTSEAGGGADFLTRVITQGIAGSLGQPLVVENRPTGVIQGQIVSKAPPDGYTLLFISDVHWIMPLLEKTPWDPVRDFSPVTAAVNSPNILVVHPNLPAKSVTELIALAKAKPGELNYAVNAAGSSSHRATELFKYMAGVNMVGVPYKGTAQGLNDVLGGRVHFMFSSSGSAAAHIKSRRLLALAVTGAKPFALNPDLPTVAESGLPGYESVSTYGIFAPARTPEAVISRLNQEVVQFLKTPKAKEQYLNVGVEVVASSPAEFAATIKSEMTRMAKLIKSAGIKVD